MRFELLGPFRVVGDRGEVAVTAGRERILLASLLLRRDELVPMPRLVDAIWGDHPPDGARGQIHGCVSRLRKRLTAQGDADPIQTDPAGYRLRIDAADVDLWQFRQLVAEARQAAAAGRTAAAATLYRSGLTLWRGAALTGVDSDLLTRAAVPLAEEHLLATEESFELELRLGGAGELVSPLTELVRAHPYRERLHAALMLALYRAGRPSDALAAYQRARRSLRDEIGQDPGPALRTLHGRILDHDPRLLADVSDRSARPPARYLPRALPDFTGRPWEVDRLVAAARTADRAPSPVLTVDGMAGVGKTTLALHVAHLLAPDYPDGQLFVDLGGHLEPPTLDVRGALDLLLRQIGVPGSRIPATLPERTGLWQSELAGRRVLLVLDNAAGAAQVNALLPANGDCLTLVTSRRRLIGLDGAQPQSLDVLPPGEAVALLARIAGARVTAEPDAAREVIRRCGALPLAIRLAGARLAHRPTWRVQDLADRLRGARGLLGELTAEDRTVVDAFALSYAQLVPTAQRVFRYLGLHPGGSFDDCAAAALADLNLVEARRTLDDLVDRHLVDEPQPRRYRFHDLVREYARQLTEATDPAPQRRAATARLLDYYLHAAATATAEVESPISRRNFQPGAPQRPDLLERATAAGSAWLTAERTNVTAAVARAADQGFDRYCWQTARAMWCYNYFFGHRDDLLATSLHGVAAARRLGDQDAVADARNYLASAYFRIGRYREAVQQIQLTITHRVRRPNRSDEAISRKNLGVVYAALGEFDLALAEMHRARDFVSRTGDWSVMASVNANLADVYVQIERYPEAQRHARFGLALARQVGEERIIGSAMTNLAGARAGLGDHASALRLAHAALLLADRSGDLPGVGETLSRIGATHRHLGDLATAEAYHRKALAMLDDIGDQAGSCFARVEYARTLRRLGRVVCAIDQSRKALQLATRIETRLAQARALDELAECLRSSQPATAHRHLQEARSLYRRMGLVAPPAIERRPAPRSRPAAVARR